ALALVPLPARTAELEFALGDVVDQAIAGDVIQRLGLPDIRRLLADDETQLDFPIQLGGILGFDDLVVGAAKATGSLHEEDRFGGQRHVGLRRMIGEVEANADELAGAADAS